MLHLRFSLTARRTNVKNSKDLKEIEIEDTEIEESDDTPPSSFQETSTSSCQTRRKIEDLHERRRYQDELGVFEEEFEML